MLELKGYFTNNYGPLSGSDWIKAIPEYERQAFSYIGRVAAGHGKSGGIARAKAAKRDGFGRFIKNTEVT